MSVLDQFKNALLSGVTINSHPRVRAALSYNYNPQATFISEVYPLQFISTSTPAIINIDKNSFNPTAGVFLSAQNSLQFFLDRDLTNVVSYLYTYIDTNIPATSRILTTDTLTHPKIYGNTNCKFLNNRIFTLTDGPSANTTMYRQFRLGLFNNTYGNLLSANWKLALLFSDYSCQVATHTTYADISASVAATVDITKENDFFIIQGAFTKLSTVPINFGVVANPKSLAVTSIVGFISGATPQQSPLAFIYSNFDTEVVPNNTPVYFKLNNNILFQL
jgi:hypothetical protein